MDQKPFQKEGIRKVPRNIVYFCPTAEKHPEQKQQNQRKSVLVPGFLMILQIFVSAYKKEYEDRCNNHKVKQNNDRFQVSRVSNSLHLSVLLQERPANVRIFKGYSDICGFVPKPAIPGVQE